VPVRRPLAYSASSSECRRPVPLGYQAPLAAAATELGAIGYDGVEVQLRDPQLVDVAELRSLAARAGVAIAAFATTPIESEDGLTLTSDDPLVREAAEDRLRAAVGLAAEFGGPVMIAGVRGQLGPEPFERRRRADGALLRLGHLAEERGSRLLLEPKAAPGNDFLTTTAEAAALATLAPRGLGLVLDRHHLTAAG
jgi:D-psicose/D-tagatose/L-ribulose 3-epimerase